MFLVILGLVIVMAVLAGIVLLTMVAIVFVKEKYESWKNRNGLEQVLP